MRQRALTLDPPGDLDHWRPLARAALAAGWAPETVSWTDRRHGTAGDLFATASALPEPAGAPPRDRVPAAFPALADAVLCHRDPGRLGLLYRVLWRLTHGEPRLLELKSNPDIVALTAMEKEVRRDTHKMKAFVRFREVEAGTFVAWFEPAHCIVRRVAPFFARRFAGMRWSILTPDASVHWDGEALSFASGLAQRVTGTDRLEALWRTYYANIFNPARLNTAMMTKEMPQKYWRHLPEAQLIPDLVRQAKQRTGQMIAPAEHAMPVAARRARSIPAPPSPAPPPTGSLAALQRRLAGCRDCALWQSATQVVPGSGPADAPIALVGEQPGDREDLAGEPFVGPAGQLLDRALAELQIPRDRLFLTNAVKHFKFEQRGKVRLHKRANAAEQAACRHWLRDELALLKPRLVVCLGVTAAQALLGLGITLTGVRGQLQRHADGTELLATLHPSALLRMPHEDFETAYADWRDDLAVIKGFLAPA